MARKRRPAQPSHHAYTFTVTATNAAGTSSASAASSSVTPAGSNNNSGTASSGTPAGNSNKSGTASSGTVTTATLDVQAPSAPTGLHASFVDGTLVLTCTPAQDNVAIDHYEIILDGAIILRVPATAGHASVTGVKPGTLTIRAIDTAGNASPTTTPITLTRTARPTAPQRIPGWAWKLLA